MAKNSTPSAFNALSLFCRTFSPSWMSITTGTGSVAITIGMFPYAFAGQQALALAVWCIDCLLLALFIGLLAARLLFFPRALRSLLEQPSQAMFLGTLPMSISVLTGGVVRLLVPRFGESALTAAHTLAWINLPIVAVIALLVPFYTFSVHNHRLETMTAVWLVPVIPATAAASVTGALAECQLLHHSQSVRLLYLGVCMLAVGFALSYHVRTIYYQRLVCHSLPPREAIVSCFTPVGAVGMICWAIINLAKAAELHVSAYVSQLPDSHPMVQAWLQSAVLPTFKAAAGVLGLCMWAYSAWWLLLAVCSVAHTLRGGIPFSLGWWAAVFPIGTFAGSTLALGQLFQSHSFQLLGAAISCCQVAVWLFVSAMTIHNAIVGDLLHPPSSLPPSQHNQSDLPTSSASHPNKQPGVLPATCHSSPFAAPACGRALSAELSGQFKGVLVPQRTLSWSQPATPTAGAGMQHGCSMRSTSCEAAGIAPMCDVVVDLK